MKRIRQLIQRFDDRFRDGREFAPGAGKLLLFGAGLFLVMGVVVWLGPSAINSHKQRQQEAKILAQLERGDSIPLFITGVGLRSEMRCGKGLDTCTITVFHEDPYDEQIVFTIRQGVIEDRFQLPRTPSAEVLKAVIGAQWTVRAVGDGDPNRPAPPTGGSWRVIPVQPDDPEVRQTEEWVKRRIRASFPDRVFRRFYPGG